MSLQFISDSTGETTGVFIPIEEWNELKGKFKGIEQAEIAVPGWHVDVLNKRLADYKNDPTHVMDFDAAMDEIEKGL
ncbi:addiction module protein [Mucilaginibacter rigui]|uniref:Addiction module protein n=1 Tax=Mucilaginibacter rigui TaxID=534635 RepID=A0ABR7WZU6_9SPHI|nr:addiction module protein [Mucilaginibacter rigui]MBD1383859.1 addiction module protein [Mucilaginibacter rigui]